LTQPDIHQLEPDIWCIPINYFTLLQTDTMPVAHYSVFTGQMLFLMPTNSVKALKARETNADISSQ